MAEAIQEEIEETGKRGVFFSPEGIMMIIIAGIIDFLDLITASFFVVDLFALVFVGGWILFRSGMLKVRHRTEARVAKATKWVRRLRWLRPLLIFLEFIPVIGAAPCWTLLVYFELKSS